MSDTDERGVRIRIEYVPVLRMWSWRVVLGLDEWAGYEHDYMNAEGQVSDVLRELRDEVGE